MATPAVGDKDDRARDLTEKQGIATLVIVASRFDSNPDSRQHKKQWKTVDTAELKLLIYRHSNTPIANCN